MVQRISTESPASAPFRAPYAPSVALSSCNCRVETDWGGALTWSFAEKPCMATFSLLTVVRHFASVLGGVWGSCGVCVWTLNATPLEFDHQAIQRLHRPEMIRDYIQSSHLLLHAKHALAGSAPPTIELRHQESTRRCEWASTASLPTGGAFRCLAPVTYGVPGNTLARIANR